MDLPVLRVLRQAPVEGPGTFLDGMYVCMCVVCVSMYVRWEVAGSEQPIVVYVCLLMCLFVDMMTCCTCEYVFKILDWHILAFSRNKPTRD